jgi:hypothetical protein
MHYVTVSLEPAKFVRVVENVIEGKGGGGAGGGGGGGGGGDVCAEKKFYTITTTILRPVALPFSFSLFARFFK